MMNKLILFSLLFFGVSLSFGQERSGDLTIYSNTGKKFYVVLNGVRQNIDAQTNVKVSGLKDRWYSCKIIAEDKSFSIDKNIGVKFDTLVTYRIKGKKSKYKMRYFSEIALKDASPDIEQTTVVYHSEDSGNNLEQTTNGNGVSNVEKTTTTTTVTSSSTTSTNSENTQNNNGNINVGIAINENGMTTTTNGEGGVNIGFTVSENGMNTNISGSGSGTGQGTGPGTGQGNQQGGKKNNSQTTTTETTTTTTTTIVNGQVVEETHFLNADDSKYEEGNIYSDDDMFVTLNSGNCYISDEAFKQNLELVANESFSEDKMRIAKSTAEHKCLTIDQIATMAKEFSFSEDRMNFVKAAYDNCLEQAEYINLMPLFTFSEDKTAFEKFVQSK
jgi:hypothetical protein